MRMTFDQWWESGPKAWGPSAELKAERAWRAGVEFGASDLRAQLDAAEHRIADLEKKIRYWASWDNPFDLRSELNKTLDEIEERAGK